MLVKQLVELHNGNISFLSQLDKQISKIDYSTKVDNDFMKRAVELVEENIQDPGFSVEEFCKTIFKSRPVVYHKLKALTNKSPQDFIKHIRMQKALELLTNTDLNVNEIAFSVGFTDQRYFSTSFKKVFGVSPSNYKNSF